MRISDAVAIRPMVKNILALYLDADTGTQHAGRVWYRLERRRLTAYARAHDLAPAAVIGAAAAISPGMKWEHVLAYVDALRVNPRASVPTYSREFCRRASAILDGRAPLDVLGGLKVTNFYLLLAGLDMSAVCVDGHAWNICIWRPHVFRHRPDYRVPAAARVTARRYRLARLAYLEAGEILGEPGHSVQACTWLHWRNIWR